MPVEHFTGCKLAYIVDNMLLVYMRDDFAHIPFPALWDFPGGGREGEETPEQCVLRELDEEFAISVSESRLIYKKKVRNHTNDGNAYFFVVQGNKTEIDAICFSSEGQYWQLMAIDQYMAHPKAIPTLASRLSAYLEGL